MNKKRKFKSSYFLYQPILFKIMVDLKTLERRNFAPYQMQDLFWPNVINIIARNPQDFLKMQNHMYLVIFHKSRFNLRFWTILDRITKIWIMQLKLNRVEENVQIFFPRKISVILKKYSIETIEDFFYCQNLYELFRLTDIDSFDLGFQELYNNLYHICLLSKIDAMKKPDQITNEKKIARLKKMAQIFKFDTLKVSEFFGWNIYRLLTEAGLRTLKDLSDFEEIDTLIPQEHRQEFDLKLSAIYYSFSFLEEIKNRISH